MSKKQKLYDEDGNEVRGAKIKKPFYKRWWFIALAVIVIIAAVTGGDEDDSEVATEEDVEVVEEVDAEDSNTEDVEEASEDIEESEESSNEIVLGEPIDLGDYSMTIQSYELGTDYEGNDALIITYDWVNNSEDSASPFMTFSLKGFQNGVETEDVFMVDGVDLGIGQKEVRPEGVIEGAQDIVGIDELSEPLELELDELFSFNDNAYISIIDLTSLE